MAEAIVSIIIPCFQQGRFLCECIRSLQLQSYSNWEAFIVNDGSSDETEEISIQLSKSDSRIHYIRKKNGGVSSARNTALSLAAGEYIQFLDPDDKLEINKISHQVKFLNRDNQLDAVYGNAWYFTDQRPEIFRHIFKKVNQITIGSLSLHPTKDPSLKKFSKKIYFLSVHRFLENLSWTELENLMNPFPTMRTGIIFFERRLVVYVQPIVLKTILMF